MRKWSYLAEPLEDCDTLVHKIMIYQTPDSGTYVFLYNSPDALFCFGDEWYEDLQSALDVWEPLLDGSGWIVIDDPLPDCQHDCVLPIRVKGRDVGKPQWGEYEVLGNGSWVEYVV